MAGFLAAAGLIGGAASAAGHGLADSHKRAGDVGGADVIFQTATTDNVFCLEHHCGFHFRRVTGLIESLSPSGRRRLSAELAKRLRQSQQRRVMAQKAPDGTPYAPRQQQSARKKTGRVKRKMFAKLITSRFLHIRASPEQASMEFYGGKSPKIASVHQFGLSEENRKDGKKIDYPARPLLGFTGEDVQMIEEIILAHLER